ncbi:hypothetical protein JOD43_003493 [Pullulanibacillus pueri]|uniref:DUF5703 domain-containing protein n=1 Tax=Pullulanibacillus pueri TaxID=1437324 RepID=A0A8J3EN12_9BACL|nr:DUF5703 domain-containing protein [Pullulanibacillus pueri]MBM7683313.1 hypothetical protein [Pullulanibacillus pueri]GGH86421.1 hypothetical protein GCM10007096_34090 [Pullulanibacillus pueri]
MKVDLNNYNIIWHSQSQNSSESMPVGGHDIGLNVWVEQGDIYFYIDRSGSFDENNQMLKLGRVKLRLSPNPFRNGTEFTQELKLLDGYMEIKGKTANGLEACVLLWVDVFHPVIHLEIKCKQPIQTEISYENWRMQERKIPHDRRMACLSTVGYPGEVTTKPDYVNFHEDDILFYHRNRNDELFFDKVVDQQGLTDYKDKLWNPQKNNTFGGIVRGEGMKASSIEGGSYIRTPHMTWKLVSVQPQTNHHIAIYLHTEQTETFEQWQNRLYETVSKTESKVDESKEYSKQWWNNFWKRSYISIDPDRKIEDKQPWQVGRNYNLFRYMLGCNAFGTYPTKFNGGLFTSDPSFVMKDEAWENETPDFRKWGGGSFTAQNQRLVYWPLLKSGDYELMKPQFDFYSRALTNAEIRTNVYWGHGGCSFTEQLENFGLPIGWGWGWLDSPDKVHCRRPFNDSTEQMAPWIKYHYVNQLEFSFMIMKYHFYSGADIQEYIPFIESSLTFFDEHYQYMYALETTKKLDENGKLVLFPSTACETYKLAMNPSDLVAALDANVQAILGLPEKYITDERKAYYRELRGRIPELQFREIKGKKTIAPAESWKGIINVEIPQLYPVFPYEQYGIGKRDMQVAIDTWHYGTDIPEQKNHISWHQDGIFCARLGLTDEAAAIAIKKLSNGNCRFPAFWGPGHDWLPDHNWGGTGMIGLQDMLMQQVGEKIYILPAWPKDWDVDFKLHASGRTVIEGCVRDGCLEDLVVTPNSRSVDVVNCWG